MDLLKINSDIFSKAVIEQFKTEVFEKVENNEIDPLMVAAAIKVYKSIIDGESGKSNGLSHLIQKKVIDEYDKYNQRKLSYHGFELEKAEAGSTYDYSADPIWNSIAEEVDRVKEKLKAREEQLKALSIPDRIKGESNNMVLDPSTGELYEEMPPVKRSTTIVKLTLKNK